MNTCINSREKLSLPGNNVLPSGVVPLRILNDLSNACGNGTTKLAEEIDVFDEERGVS